MHQWSCHASFDPQTEEPSRDVRNFTDQTPVRSYDDEDRKSCEELRAWRRS
jgi:hypothetical protein